MSAFGTKQTLAVAPHMSAFGGKADMTFCENPLSRSLLGEERTCPFAAHMSASDPKRTSTRITPTFRDAALGRTMACYKLQGRQ
jgi:hypothetical protein